MASLDNYDLTAASDPVTAHLGNQRMLPDISPLLDQPDIGHVHGLNVYQSSEAEWSSASAISLSGGSSRPSSGSASEPSSERTPPSPP